MITRFATAIGVGAVVTFGLLFLMQLLVARSGGGLGEARTFELGDFVRVEREQVAERREREVEKPPEPEQQPDLPPQTTSDTFNNSLSVSVATPTVRTSFEMGGLGFGVNDGEYLPIVKVQPVYPARAAARGLEGYVIVEFTVTTTGTTRDIFVYESSSSLFERAAIDAAAKFKYRPRVIDGEPVEVPGVRNRITFVLED
jgi:protein TonB